MLRVSTRIVARHAGPTPAAVARPDFRFDVEGLRAVAILLVASFHVWGGGRVSGGVDVFLMISGFFVGGALLRRVGSGAPFALGTYVLKLGRRLLPPLLLTLAAVVVGTWLWLPRAQWSDVSGGVLASATYLENWRMAIAGQAYAAADPMSSPVQHIWSLSVQGQIFIGLPLLLLSLRWLLGRRGLDAEQTRRVLVWCVAVLAGASLVYAVVGVQLHQNFTYFDTGARVWEYLAGTLVAVAAPLVRLPARLAAVLGWVGLGMILLTGVVLDARATFPGIQALLPIGGAVLVVVSGFGASAERGPTTRRVLGWRPLAAAGGYAYEFYLWHWVVLVFALAATGRESFGWLAGSVVLLVSGVAAWAARLVTDRLAAPVLSGSWRASGQRARQIAVSSILVATLAAPVGWLGYRSLDPWTGSGDLDLALHPGALTLTDAETWPTADDVDFVPSEEDARSDWPITYLEDCPESQTDEAEYHICVLGDTTAPFSVALVGNSLAVGTGQVLDAVAREAGVRIEAIFKQGCPLAVLESTGDPVLESCIEWNRAVMDHLIASPIDVVITPGTRPASEVAQEFVGDYVPDYYAQAWRVLLDHGMTVAPVRNGPRFAVDVPSCIDRYGATSMECVVGREVALGEDPFSDPFADVIESDRFTPIDLSDAYCEAVVCRPVVGNVLVYIDDYHTTGTFGQTLVLPMADQLSAMPWWP